MMSIPFYCFYCHCTVTVICYWIQMPYSMQFLMRHIWLILKISSEHDRWFVWFFGGPLNQTSPWSASENSLNNFAAINVSVKRHSWCSKEIYIIYIISCFVGFKLVRFFRCFWGGVGLRVSRPSPSHSDSIPQSSQSLFTLLMLVVCD